VLIIQCTLFGRVRQTFDIGR